MRSRIVLGCCALILIACRKEPWNSPYPSRDAQKNILYSSFIERPKTLDPASSYSSDESLFTAQIYEPPLQYDYLKRPYALIPLTATRVPEPEYYDKQGRRLAATADPKQVSKTYYTISVKPGIYYQPHPAFAKDREGHYLYHHKIQTTAYQLSKLADLKQGTRELIAEDYVYQIKRLASPKTDSPILGLMAHYIEGLKAYAEQLAAYRHLPYLDLRRYPLSGVKVLDRYTYQIQLQGQYPQFVYWLAMPFFSPIPWEADRFYAEPGMSDNNMTLAWYPVGTGPYLLQENNPNRRMVLIKNPYFHGEYYPTTGSLADRKAGFLVDAGKRLPFVDKIVFSLEKESIPRWEKFLQGYYDYSGVGEEGFDQAVQINSDGRLQAAPELKQKNIRLHSSLGTSIFYFGFNMKDPIVGGYSEAAKNLRLAISIAFNMEEYINLFLNGQAIPAQGPLAPGIFGYHTGATGFNPFIYDWDGKKIHRKSLAEAKRLLALAGYPGGRSSKTGQSLLLHFDVTDAGGSGQQAQFAWMVKQFKQLGIQLNVRATQYNQFQQKMQTGNVQLFSWGWLADYPDPENYLFLLYGPNSKVLLDGENAANYENPRFDALFEKIRALPNGEERERWIQMALSIARQDAPWIWGYHPKQILLAQAWNRANKPNDMARNTIKYTRIDPLSRAIQRQRWNEPILWPLGLLWLCFLLGVIPLAWAFYQREYTVRT